MSKKAFSTQLTEEALNSMGLNMTSSEKRCLAFFTHDMATRTATVKSLQLAVAQYRIDPIALLETKGIGKATLRAVRTLHNMIAAQETMREFGVNDNLTAVQTILQTCKRGVCETAVKEIQTAQIHLQHAAVAQRLYTMVTPDPKE